jgi:hypothetical protein
VADVCLALVVDLCRVQVIVQMMAAKHKHCQIRDLAAARITFGKKPAEK